VCILFIGIDQHPDYPLIIAANRDEFFARPTAQSHFWSDHPALLAGQDLQAGGSWMAVNKNGRLAALTNVRDPQRINPKAQSRGGLVTRFTQGLQDNAAYLDHLRQSRQDYNGYNLLFGQWHDLWVYNNHSNCQEKLYPGVYGLSNASLNSPWPKINSGMRNLQHYCHNSDEIIADKLFELLHDETKAADHLLPQTGIPLEWERQLSSIFIRGQDYGTRCSTLLLVDKNLQLSWFEKTFAANGVPVAQQTYHFVIN
jgi:uncharacterized protein with NRDE domain